MTYELPHSTCSMCLVVNEERGWLYKAPYSHFVKCWFFLLVNIHIFLRILCLVSLTVSLSLCLTYAHIHISIPLHRISPRFFTINYPVYDKELASIISAFVEWRPYLVGAQHRIQVLTCYKTRMRVVEMQRRFCVCVCVCVHACMRSTNAERARVT